MDFLTFKSFISTEVLIVFYYLGATIMPIGLWLVFIWLLKKYKLINAAYKNSKELMWRSLTRKQKKIFVASFVVCFLFMELFWRIFFEYLIAYLQMRDALLHINR